MDSEPSETGKENNMMINLYSQPYGSETWDFESQCEVAECFPDDPESAAHARAALVRDGVFITGGGAAPLFRLVLVDSAG